jgi:hypothetical protein
MLLEEYIWSETSTVVHKVPAAVRRPQQLLLKSGGSALLSKCCICPAVSGKGLEGVWQ